MRKIIFSISMTLFFTNLWSQSEVINPAKLSSDPPSGYPLGFYTMPSESDAPYSWRYDAGVIIGVKPVSSNFRHIQFINSAKGNMLSIRSKNGTDNSWGNWYDILTSELYRGVSGVGSEGQKVRWGITGPYISSIQTGSDSDSQGLVFYTHPSGNSQASAEEAMRLHSGKVSIGTPHGGGGELTIFDQEPIGSSLYPYRGGLVINGISGNSVIRMGSGTGGSGDYWYMRTHYNGNNNYDFSMGTVYSWNDSDVERLKIMSNGNVAIGVDNPGSYKLNVWGRLRAHEIVVNTTGADYVFEDGYNLRSLEEVEQFIQQHNHLPGIKSAAEMQANGMAVADLNTRLLEKIEELTLYLIELQKKNLKLHESNADLTNRIETLEKKIK